MRAQGANGRQRCLPAVSSVKLRPGKASGRRRTTPRSRVGSGTVTSSNAIVSVVPSHATLLGPMSKRAALRAIEARLRSVQAQRWPVAP